MQPLPDFVTRCWRRHELRRGTEIPTVTVFAGHADISSSWLEMLADEEQLSTFHVHSTSSVELASHWLRQSLLTCQPQKQALALLAQSTQETEAELQAGWRARSPRERQLWLESQLEGDVRADLRGALLWLARQENAGVETHETRDPVSELMLLTTWLPRVLWPVPCLLRPTERMLAAAAQLSMHVPALSLIAVVDEIAWQQFGPELTPRYGVLLAEGVIAQDVGSSAVGEQFNHGADPQLRRAYLDACKVHQQLMGLSPEQRGRDRELEGRARSHAELLLFRLLELQPATRGLFGLNVQMPFLFGSRPAEVDLVCRTLQIAVEVDGYYHFTGETAYRRDRHKDLLLQKHGFFVTRHLASDVITRSNDVVQQIVQLTHHRQLSRHRRVM